VPGALADRGRRGGLCREQGGEKDCLHRSGLAAFG